MATRPPTRLAYGTMLMLAAMVLLPIMDGIAKGLTLRYPVAQVVWARYLFHFAVMFPVLLARLGPRALVPKHVGSQLIRGTLLLAATVLFFFALASMPQATALALFFVSPLVVTMLAPALLGERVGVWRASAVAVGFVGVLLILRPGSEVFAWGALLAVAAGTVHGLYMLYTRKLAGTSPPLVTLAYTAVVGAVVMTGVMAFVWVPPTPRDFGAMALLGLLAAGGHFLLIKAFDHAPATWLAPLGYTEMITAAIVGYVQFRHLPDAMGWLGIAIIVGAGVVISLRERRGTPALRPGGIGSQRRAETEAAAPLSVEGD